MVIRPLPDGSHTASSESRDGAQREKWARDARRSESRRLRFRRIDRVPARAGGGASLGQAAWGGAHCHLTAAQRIGSVVSVVFYLLAIACVRGRAGGRRKRRCRWD